MSWNGCGAVAASADAMAASLMPMPRRMNQLASSTRSRDRPLIRDRGSARQRHERHHRNDMMAEPEPICRDDRFGPEIAGGCRCVDRSDKERVNPLEDSVEQLPGILAVLEKAVQHQAEACVELDPVGAAEQKITHHKRDHVDEGGRRRFERGETLERRIAFAARLQDLAVKMFFAWKMPEQQRLGNASRLGQLLGGRAGKPSSGKKRHRRGNDRLAPLVTIQSDGSHRGGKVSAYLHAVKRPSSRRRR